ncbi:uncharacterized protein LOC144440177 isoform X2 [Glandiceps talaboti]
MAEKPEDSRGEGRMSYDKIPETYLVSIKHLSQRNYRQFGRYLDLTSSDLESIEYYYKDSGFGEINCQIVRRWLEKTTSKAPYLDFVRALEHVGLRRVAEEFKKSYSYPREESGEEGVGTNRQAILQGSDLSSGNHQELQQSHQSQDQSRVESKDDVKNQAKSADQSECIPFSATTPQTTDRVQGLKLPNVLHELRSPSDMFTGKAQHKVLEEIGIHYTKHKNKNPEQWPLLVEILQGLGGSGKTEIASHYVFDKWKEYSGGVFHLSGQSKSFLDFGLRKMLQEANINLEDDANPRHIRQRALNWLRNHSDWLLFIDDADEPRLIKNLFPEKPKLFNGHIVITSRVCTKWDRWYDVINTPVPHLTRDDSALYLIRAKESIPTNHLTMEDALNKLEELKLRNKEEFEAVTWLGGVSALHGLPLALRQARDYINEFGLSFNEYKAQYMECRIDIFHHSDESDPLEDWLESNNIDTKYVAGLREKVGCDTLRLKSITEEELRSQPVAMDESDVEVFIDAREETSRETFAFMLDPSKDNFLTTWRLNYSKICCNEEAREFLQLCSCLSSTINTSLFTAGAKFLNHCSLKKFLLGDNVGEDESKQSEAEHCRKVRELIRLLNQFSFVTTVVGHSRQDTPEHDLSQFGTFVIHHLVQQVVFLRLITHRDEKVRSVNNIMRILQGLFPNLDEVISDNFDGLYNDNMRDRHSIIAMHTQALATQIETLSHEDIAALENTNCLFTAVGAYLRRLDRAYDARLLYRLMVRICRMRKPLNKEYLADGLRYLAMVNNELGCFEKAEQCLVEAQDLYRKADSDDNIKIAYTLLGLARVRMDNKTCMEKDESRCKVKSWLLEALERQQKHTPPDGKDHISIATALHHLGRFYQETGEYDKAHGYFTQSIDLRERHMANGAAEGRYVNGYVNHAIVQTNLARNYLLRSDEQQQYIDMAEELLLKALETMGNILQESNDSVQLGVYNLAALYRHKGEGEKSKMYEDRIQFEYLRKKLQESEAMPRVDVYEFEDTKWL